MNKSTGQQIDYLHKKVKSLQTQNCTDEEIIDRLKKEDAVDEFYAKTLLDNLENDKANKKDFWKMLFMGVFFIAAGLGINYFSYTIAENSGSSFFYLFWGIVAFGVVTVIRAFILHKK